MNNPVTEVLALGRVPAAVAGDTRAIAEAALRVSVIERTLISLLTAVIERALLDLKEKLDTATERLPDIDQDDRGPLLKAKDAITGG